MSDNDFTELQRDYLAMLDECCKYSGTWMESFYKSVLGNLLNRITNESSARMGEVENG